MIQKIYKVFNVSASHQLKLPYNSKCNLLHGHNYKIEVSLGGILNSFFILMDFSELSEIIKRYDHTHLNDIFEDDKFNGTKVQTTAEMLSMRICRDIVSTQIKTEKENQTIKGIQVRVWETEKCYAETYIQEEEFKTLLETYTIDGFVPIPKLRVTLPEFESGGIVEQIVDGRIITKKPFDVDDHISEMKDQTGETNENK